MEAEHRFVVCYDQLPSQQRFHQLATKYRGYSGPVGSGKTMCLVQQAIRLAFVNAGLTGLIGAPTFPMLRDATQSMMLAVLGENGIPYRFLKQENTLIVTAGGINSSIHFRSMEEPERLRGTNLAWFCVDELTYCKYASWQRLKARLRDPRASDLAGNAVWTPRGFDPVYDDFVSPSTRKPDHGFVKGVPKENFHVADQGYYDSLKISYDEKFYAQEALGEYLNVNSGSAYSAFDAAEHVRACEPHPDAQFWLACDFNINPMCWLFVQSLAGRVEVLEEVCRPATIDQACEEMVGKIEARVPAIGRGFPYPLEIRLVGDSAGNARGHAGKSDYQLILEYFKKVQTMRLRNDVPSASPAIRDRVNAVNAMLRNATGQIRLHIDQRCKTLQKDLERVVWQADLAGNYTGDLEKTKDPMLTHVSDALGYMIHREFPVSAFRREIRPL